MLKSVIVQVAQAKGFTPAKQGEGGRAIAYLSHHGHLPLGDGGEFVRGA
jgi:hypothetical protein